MPELSRRQFLLAAGASSAVVFTGCQPPMREFNAESRVRLAEDVVTAYENWYATTCRMCGAGCGVIARVIEGRAKKIEGNPDHPISRGKLCARGQAIVQDQYHPDRLIGPMSLRGGRRPVGQLLGDNWDQGLTRLVDRLKATPAGQTVLITGPLRGHQALVADRFARGTGARWMQLDLFGETQLREASRRVFGQETLPYFDVEHARTVLSIGADWLGTWLSDVNMNVQYGNFRQGSYKLGQAFKPRHAGEPRGYLVHVDSRFSPTAANADEWIWVRPGTEGVFALSLANALIAAGADQAGAGAFGGATGLANYAPDRVAQQTGVDAAKVNDLARRLMGTRPSLVIGGGSAGGHSNGTASLSAILGLNLLLGAVGREGGVLPNPAPVIEGLPTPRPAAMNDWLLLRDQINSGQVTTVLVYGVDPVYALPPWVGIGDAFDKLPFLASFSPYLDETASRATLVLPSHLTLEDWGDDVPEMGPGYPIWSVQQPVLKPFFDTRSFFDVLLVVGEELGGNVAQQLPWRTFRDVLKQGAQAVQRRNAGSVREPDVERFWVRALQQGGWWDTARPPAATGVPAGAAGALGPVVTSFPQTRYAGGPEYPFHLALFEHNTLGKGETAHLPWLQATPDPITSATWQTWVEVSSKTAREMDLREGDIVRVESPRPASLELPVYINPAAPPEVLAIPLGQGHREYGRWAKDRGANPLGLLDPIADADTGALAYAATRVRLVKTGRKTRIPKFEGNVESRQLEGETILKVTPKV